jgi:hypothetical protein
MCPLWNVCIKCRLSFSKSARLSIHQFKCSKEVYKRGHLKFWYNEGPCSIILISYSVRSILELYTTECVVYFVHMFKRYNNTYNFALPFLSEMKIRYVKIRSVSSPSTWYVNAVTLTQSLTHCRNYGSWWNVIYFRWKFEIEILAGITVSEERFYIRANVVTWKAHFMAAEWYNVHYFLTSGHYSEQHKTVWLNRQLMWILY